MFKPAKATKGYKTMQRMLKEVRLTEVAQLYLKKKGGETSNAMFLIKGMQLNQPVHRVLRLRCCQLDPSYNVWENFRAFWGNTETVKKTVADLKSSTEKIIFKKLKQRR